MTPSVVTKVGAFAKLFFSSCLLVAAISCATTTRTEAVLREYTGRPITALIEERQRYPADERTLPSGNKVFYFEIGSGARVDQYGNVLSGVCKTWIETDAAGIIVRWRFENCQ